MEINIEILLVSGIGVIFGAIIGFRAKRKNRNGWLWGISFGLSVILGYNLLYSGLGGSYAHWSFGILGLLGVLSWFIGMIVLAFLKPLCPKCKNGLTRKQWKEKTCPACGSIGANKQQAGKVSAGSL